MQPGGGADSHRSSAVPLVLSTCVDVGVGIAEENVHGFSAGGSHFGGLKAELVGDVVRDSGRTVVGHNDVAGEWPEDGFDVIGVEDYAEVGQADGGGNGEAVFNEGDVHGPVLPPGGEFFGAVKGVDNPDAVFAEARGVVGGFFGKESVVGSVLFEDACDPALGEVVTSLTEVAAAEEANVSNTFEDFAGALREASGEDGVVKVNSHNLNPSCLVVWRYG